MNQWKEDMTHAGLNPRKEITVALLLILPFAGIAALMYSFLGASFYLVIPFIVWLLVSYFYLGRCRKILAQRQDALENEFVHLFTFFGVYIQDGFNVYSALREINAFSSPEMNKLLSRLLEEMEEDKSVQPYIHFADHFSEVSVKQVMISIYQMVEEGQGGVFVRQFERLFGKLSDQKHLMEKEKWKEKLETLSFLPLAGSGIAMISLSLCLMNIMEGTLNVL